MQKRHALIVGITLALTTLSCTGIRLFAQNPTPVSPAQVTQSGDVEQPVATFPPPNTPTPLATSPVQPGSANPDEPVLITGSIELTNDLFRALATEPYVVLTDSAGYATRDEEREISPYSQVLGYVEPEGETNFAYQMMLPGVPQGTLVDVDNDGEADAGVQIYTLDFGWNIWGGPFLDDREAIGWGGGFFSSVLGDAENEYHWNGGTLIVWVPNDAQQFPTGFGDDGLLFTTDDPIGAIPPGYNFVDMNEDPFRVYKSAHAEITLEEGNTGVNDYSDMSYQEAFDTFFEKASREYPFTEQKNVDWDALYDEHAPRVADANTDEEFAIIIRDMLYSIPDGHIGGAGLLIQDEFFPAWGGGYGLIIAELSDGRVLVTDVLPDTPAAEAGIEVGAELLEWDGQPMSAHLDQTPANVIGPTSTPHAGRQMQLVFAVRGPVDISIDVTFQNRGDSAPQTERMDALLETDSLIQALFPDTSSLYLPVEGEVLPSGVGYITISSFSDDTHLAMTLFDRYIKQMIDSEVPALVIDLRSNGGGTTSGYALAGYFIDEDVDIGRSSYYSEDTGAFEADPDLSTLEPADVQYEGPIAVLVSANCVSACEGFAYILSLNENVQVFGHTPTAGAYGEVARGQYELPGGIELQIPTGRFESPSGDLLIEGTGVIPDVIVPVTEASVLNGVDELLDAAVEALLEVVN